MMKDKNYKGNLKLMDVILEQLEEYIDKFVPPECTSITIPLISKRSDEKPNIPDPYPPFVIEIDPVKHGIISDIEIDQSNDPAITENPELKVFSQEFFDYIKEYVDKPTEYEMSNLDKCCLIHNALFEFHYEYKCQNVLGDFGEFIPASLSDELMKLAKENEPILQEEK